MKKKIYNHSSHFEWLEFEATSKEAMEKIKDLKATGLVIDSYSSEPIIYKYRVKYIAPTLTQEQKEKEEWRDIPGKFFGMYQVSSFKRLRRLRILADYGTIVLHDNENNRLSVKVDRLYKLAFKK